MLGGNLFICTAGLILALTGFGKSFVDANCSSQPGTDLRVFTCEAQQYLICQGDPATWGLHESGSSDGGVCAIVVDCSVSSSDSLQHVTIPGNLTQALVGNKVLIQIQHCQLQTLTIEYNSMNGEKDQELLLQLGTNAIGSLKDVQFKLNPQQNTIVALDVDLSNNRLTQLTSSEPQEEWFKNIQKLSLDNNSISNISDNILQALPNLTELSLRGNQLQSFPQDKNHGEYNLRKLDLSFNELNKVSCFHLGVTGLTEMFLHNNSISEIDECIQLKKMFARGRYSLGGNPLDCCGLRWLQDIMLATDALLDPNDTWCDTPKVLQFSKGRLNDFNCLVVDDDNGLKVVVGAVLGTFACLVMVFIIGFLLQEKLKNRQRAQANITGDNAETGKTDNNGVNRASNQYEPQRPLSRPEDAYETLDNPPEPLPKAPTNNNIGPPTPSLAPPSQSPDSYDDGTYERPTPSPRPPEPGTSQFPFPTQNSGRCKSNIPASEPDLIVPETVRYSYIRPHISEVDVLYSKRPPTEQSETIAEDDDATLSPIEADVIVKDSNGVTPAPNGPDVIAEEGNGDFTSSPNESDVIAEEGNGDVTSPRSEPDIIVEESNGDVTSSRNEPDIIVEDSNGNVTSPRNEPDVSVEESNGDDTPPRNEPDVAAEDSDSDVAQEEGYARLEIMDEPNPAQSDTTVEDGNDDVQLAPGVESTSSHM